MALCKDMEKLRASKSPAFDKVIRPGTDTPYEGIYRCLGCGMEIAALGGRPFPTTKQRPHSPGCPDGQWQLLVGLSA